MKIQVQRLNKDIKMPTYAHAGDAAFDLLCAKEITINPGERAQVQTGIALAIPEGYVGLIWEKSGLSHTHGLTVLGGVIDAGYRDEVLVGIANLSDTAYTFSFNHKVAQMIIQQREHVILEEIESLDINTERGLGGFGSSGK